MYYPITGWMLFDADQLSFNSQPDLFEPPVILHSGNGWIYKPDEARTPQEIKRGTNKAWPRKRRDYGKKEYHEEWHSAFVEDELAKRNWALPSKIERPEPNPHAPGNNSFSIHWDSQPWGWQSISLNIREPSQYGYGDKKVTLTYSLNTHPAAHWFESKKVENCYRGDSDHEGSVALTDRDEVRDRVREWLADPWGVTIANISCGGIYTTDELVKPPLEKIGSVEYLDDDIDGVADGLDFYGLHTGNAEFWTKGKIDQIMKSDVAWSALTKLIKAFEFTGYNLRVNTEYNYHDDADMPVTGLVIEIPDDPNSTKRSRKKGHKITIDRGGISVSCGYVQDEKLWMDREKRMAKEHMALLEEDLFTEFSIDLNDE